MALERRRFIENCGLTLIDTDGWTDMDPDRLVGQSQLWKDAHLATFRYPRKDDNRGTIEWLIGVLRHNCTNYDAVQKATSAEREWIAGASSELRTTADDLVLLHFSNKGEEYYEGIKESCRRVRAALRSAEIRRSGKSSFRNSMSNPRTAATAVAG